MKSQFTKKTFFIQFAAGFLASILLQSTASATTITLNSFAASPSPINTGDSSAWALGLTLNATHSGERFSSADLTFSSGDGQTTVYSGLDLTGYSPSNPITLSSSFGYGVAGNYFGSVLGTVTASWQQYDPVYGMVDNWVKVQTGTSCNALGFNCTPVYEWFNQPVLGVTGSQLNTYSEVLGIDAPSPGQLSTSWQQYDPVYGLLDNWVKVQTGTSCDALGFNCSPVYDWINLPVWGVTGSQLNTYTQTLSFNALSVTQGSGVQGASVPEPATLSLIGLGLAGLGLTRRRMLAQKSAS